MLFVNSADVARDLFDKRSSLYSDRFDFPMLMMHVTITDFPSPGTDKDTRQDGVPLQYRVNALWGVVASPSQTVSSIFPPQSNKSLSSCSK